MLKIYNTLSKTLEEFKPIKPGQVTIYVCGPTVYDYLHVGNFRGPVFFNLVRNWLEHLGYKVEYALNFTDVDDKIIKRALAEKKPSSEVSEFYIAEYTKDFLSLGLRKHDHNPKVTDHMPQIISMISQLIENKKAYATVGNSDHHDVNFSIADFKDYGKLSGRKPEELQAGVRIEIDEKKKSPLDFALWKAAKPDEVSWPSPWGPGRPGWHIECSAMIQSLFGNQIDIHGGGLDLMFPHHENEIAQTEGCTNENFVKYWMHWNMIQFDGAKMSKSVGNIISLRDFLKEQHPEIYKWMMLSVHYRSLADFSQDSVDRAISGLARVYSSLALAETVLATCVSETVLDAKFKSEVDEAWKKITDALNDDFGSPAAVAVVFDMVRGFNAKHKRAMKTLPQTKSHCLQFIEFIKKFGQLLSLFQQPAHDFLTALDDQLLMKSGFKRNNIDSIVTERAVARALKDFAKSDELRKKLTEMNVAVSDLPAGSFWEVVK